MLPTQTPTAISTLFQPPTESVPTFKQTVPIGAICVSGTMTVELSNGARKKVRDLKIGDEVRVMLSDDDNYHQNNNNNNNNNIKRGASFEPIVTFGHHDTILPSKYVRVVLDDGNKLELSNDHLIFISNENNADNTNGNRKQTKRRRETPPVPASTLRVGQMLYDGRRIQKLEYDILRYGAYAPFTSSGTIVINGILISTYITLQPNQTYLQLFGSSTTTTNDDNASSSCYYYYGCWSYQFLAHNMMTIPLQVMKLQQQYSSSYFKSTATTTENDNNNTILMASSSLSTYQKMYTFLQTYWLQQPKIVMTTIFVFFILPTAMLVYISEHIFINHLLPFLFLASIFFFFFTGNNRKKEIKGLM